MNNLAPIGAREVAEQCRKRARLPTTENMTAVVLLLAANVIDSLADRTVILAATNERLEAERAA
jgi:hypothetical protein